MKRVLREGRKCEFEIHQRPGRAELRLARKCFNYEDRRVSGRLQGPGKDP